MVRRFENRLPIDSGVPLDFLGHGEKQYFGHCFLSTQKKLRKAAEQSQPDGLFFARRGAKVWDLVAKVEVQPDCEVVLKWNRASVAATDLPRAGAESKFWGLMADLASTASWVW